MPTTPGGCKSERPSRGVSPGRRRKSTRRAGGTRHFPRSCCPSRRGKPVRPRNLTRPAGGTRRCPRSSSLSRRGALPRMRNWTRLAGGTRRCRRAQVSRSRRGALPRMRNWTRLAGGTRGDVEELKSLEERRAGEKSEWMRSAGGARRCLRSARPSRRDTQPRLQSFPSTSGSLTDLTFLLRTKFIQVNLSAYFYTELSYNQLRSLLYALRNEGIGTKEVLDNDIYSVCLFSIHSLLLFWINRHDYD